MCRNITTLRGLVPPATEEEVEAAARQFVRKVTGIQRTSAATQEPFERAVSDIQEIVARLLEELPERRQPPPTVPPLRREEVRARIAAREAAEREHERAHALGLAHSHDDVEEDAPTARTAGV
ncbi:DUF2277 domain-containing protein [Cellulosimicrobium sp. PMB13]|uniref:DUF2277 domain-containing protein n=1 Tax=Cellulosimicrobium sp. PMB13 TaxID=3120158 RepID=UPI003F4C9866